MEIKIDEIHSYTHYESTGRAIAVTTASASASASASALALLKMLKVFG